MPQNIPPTQWQDTVGWLYFVVSDGYTNAYLGRAARQLLVLFDNANGKLSLGTVESECVDQPPKS